MSDLDRYLADYFEEYLFKDIDTLLKRANPAPGQKYGACGYPLLMAVFSGIERLGGLSSPAKFSSAMGKPMEYFCDYWENHLYPNNKEAGGGFYSLARHGLAHSFMVKANIEVTKDEPARHLTAVGDKVTIDSTQLAMDFQASYTKWKAGFLVAQKANVELRFKEMLDDNAKRVKEHWRKFSKLKPPVSASPMPNARTAPTGSFVNSTNAAGATTPQIPPGPASSNPYTGS